VTTRPAHQHGRLRDDESRRAQAMAQRPSPRTAAGCRRSCPARRAGLRRPMAPTLWY
jgi:hypothetical protein